MVKVPPVVENKVRHKKGIRRRVTLIICLSTLIVMSIGIGLGYLFGSNLLRSMVGDIHHKLAQLLANSVTLNFETEMERIRGYAGDPFWREALVKGSPEQEGAGDRLREIVDADNNIAEAVLIDRSGLLAAASGKTSRTDFAGGEWQKNLSSDKKRDIFIGDIEFDSGPNKWVIPIALPIKDADGGVLGVFRVGLSAEKFFSPLGDFKIDRTGHAVVIDGRGNIIFHPGVTPINVRLCSEKDYERLLTSPGRYATIYEQNIHKRPIFAAFSEVIPPLLLENNKVWRILVEEDSGEVLAPLKRITPWLIAALIFLFIVMVVIGAIFSGVLIRPIEALYAAVTQIRKGNWDYKIDVRTGDEIEQFADAFREMVSNIKSKQEELLKAKSELEDLSKNLDVKVQARTVDLKMARDKIDNYAKELERALAAKSDFIATVSHELRTPLTAIREGIEIVLSGKTGVVSDQQKEFLNMVKRNLERLGRIINNVLDFHKLEQGKMEMRILDNDMNETVKEACRVMAHLAGEKGVELIPDLALDLPIIKFDKDRITQALTNLISNAIKFTEKGSITVSTCLETNAVRVSVADTGIGIKKVDMPQIFQRFTQLEHGPERRTGGTGLGLTISKEIIEDHGGKIWAQSKPQEGTTFYFILPIKERRKS